jgi:hypothetical protein
MTLRSHMAFTYGGCSINISDRIFFKNDHFPKNQKYLEINVADRDFSNTLHLLVHPARIHRALFLSLTHTHTNVVHRTTFLKHPTAVHRPCF